MDPNILDELIHKWKVMVYDNAKEVDPEDKYDWCDLAYGFFLALKLPPKQAKEIVEELIDREFV